MIWLPKGGRQAWSQRARGRQPIMFKGPVQLSDSFALRTLAPVPDLVPGEWWHRCCKSIISTDGVGKALLECI